MTKILLMMSCDSEDRVEMIEAIEGVKAVRIELMTLKQARREFEKAYIKNQLSRMAGIVSQTARFIGMERSALHRKINNLKLRKRRKNKSLML